MTGQDYREISSYYQTQIELEARPLTIWHELESSSEEEVQVSSEPEHNQSTGACRLEEEASAFSKDGEPQVAQRLEVYSIEETGQVGAADG